MDAFCNIGQALNGNVYLVADVVNRLAEAVEAGRQNVIGLTLLKYEGKVKYD